MTSKEGRLHGYYVIYEHTLNSLVIMVSISRMMKRDSAPHFMMIVCQILVTGRYWSCREREGGKGERGKGGKGGRREGGKGVYIFPSDVRAAYGANFFLDLGLAQLRICAGVTSCVIIDNTRVIKIPTLQKSPHRPPPPRTGATPTTGPFQPQGHSNHHSIIASRAKKSLYNQIRSQCQNSPL